jgi:hypothetical protein
MSEPTDQDVDSYALSAARLRATDWVVIGIYCDGRGDDGSDTRHAPEPIATTGGSPTLRLVTCGCRYIAQTTGLHRW